VSAERQPDTAGLAWVDMQIVHWRRFAAQLRRVVILDVINLAIQEVEYIKCEVSMGSQFSTNAQVFGQRLSVLERTGLVKSSKAGRVRTHLCHNLCARQRAG